MAPGLRGGTGAETSSDRCRPCQHIHCTRNIPLSYPCGRVRLSASPSLTATPAPRLGQVVITKAQLVTTADFVSTPRVAFT